jgi:hypothetical protein
MKTKLLSSLLLALMLSYSAFSQQNALDFDNTNDYVNVPAASALIAGSNQISLTMWVNPVNTSFTYPDYDGFGGFRNNTDADFYIIQLNSTGLEARFRSASGTAFDITTNTIQSGVWQHFVLTYDGDMFKLYQNGAFVSSIPANGVITNQTIDLMMGGMLYGATNFYLKGQLDEVSLWNKALSLEEIQSIYSCGINPSSANLLLYYKFDQGIAGGNNVGITSLTPTTGTLNGNLNNFELTGPISNFVQGTGNAVNIISQTICSGQSYQFGNLTLTTPGIYTQTFSTPSGCDSVVQLSLTVTSVFTNISQAGITLAAALSSAGYQWVNCSNNFSIIQGATQQSYTATANGNYACIITSNGCSDTSICLPVTTVGIIETAGNEVSLFPNPVKDQLTLEFTGDFHNGQIILTDIQGRTMLSNGFPSLQTIQIDMTGYCQGVYYLRFIGDKSLKVWKVIKE